MSTPGSAISTRSKSLKTDSLPSPEDYWMNLGLLIQTASWYQGACAAGLNIKEVDSDVGSFICDVTTRISQFRRSTDGTRLASLQARLVDEFYLALKKFQSKKIDAISKVCQKCQAQKMCPEHEEMLQFVKNEVASALEASVRSISHYYDEATLRLNKGFLRTIVLNIDPEFVRKHGGPKEAAIQAVAMLFDMSPRQIRSSYNKFRPKNWRQTTDGRRGLRLIDHPFDKASLSQKVIREAFNCPINLSRQLGIEFHHHLLANPAEKSVHLRASKASDGASLQN